MKQNCFSELWRKYYLSERRLLLSFPYWSSCSLFYFLPLSLLPSFSPMLFFPPPIHLYFLLSVCLYSCTWNTESFSDIFYYYIFILTNVLHPEGSSESDFFFFFLFGILCLCARINQLPGNPLYTNLIKKWIFKLFWSFHFNQASRLLENPLLHEKRRIFFVTTKWWVFTTVYFAFYKFIGLEHIFMFVYCNSIFQTSIFPVT